MSSRLLDKQIKIIAIDPSGASRQLLAESIRGLGYENVQGLASIKDALGVMEVEPVDWVLTPILKDEEINAFHLLETIINHNELNGVRVSLLLENEELEVLPDAIERGVIGWFIKPFNKDSIEAALGDFFGQLESNNGSEILTLFKLYDAYLETENKHPERVALARDLLGFFTGESIYMEALLDAYNKSGDEDNAKSMLRQLVTIDPSMSEKHAELVGTLFGEEGIQSSDGDEKINILGLDQIVLIDNDDSNRSSIKEWLGELGAPEIFDFSDGEEAWQHIETQEKLSAVITEWRLPKLTGPLLVQRLRHKHPSVRIILQSSLVQGADQPLVYEMGVANIIEKPFEKGLFLSKLISTIQKDRLPVDMETLERKIRLHLAAKESDQAIELANKYYGNDQIPEERKLKIKAEIAYAQGKFEEARKLATEAIKTSTDSIMLLNLLGRIMMKTGDFVAALKCLEKAQEMSPMNLGRLCEIAEVQSEMGDAEAAKETVEQAKEQDENADSVMETAAKVEVSSGDANKAKEIMAKMDSLSEVISYMNNKAVALAKTNQITESIELYNKTFESIPDDKSEIKAIVKYNLGLAMIKQNQLPEALKAMTEALEVGNSRVKDKAASLKARVQKAIDADGELKLQSDTKEAASEEIGSPEEPPKMQEENIEIFGTITKSPGSYGFYKLYQSGNEIELVKKMLSKKLPRFSPRETIQREASLAGIEKNVSA